MNDALIVDTDPETRRVRIRQCIVRDGRVQAELGTGHDLERLLHEMLAAPSEEASGGTPPPSNWPRAPLAPLASHPPLLNFGGQGRTQERVGPYTQADVAIRRTATALFVGAVVVAGICLWPVARAALGF